MNYAQIILPLHLKGTYTYKIPKELIGVIQVGMRVLVPFGGKKIYTGLVAELHNQAPETFIAKEVIAHLDPLPILPETQLKFWEWLSNYYLCNLGDIYRFAFPASLKLESETYLKLRPHVKIEFENLDVNEMYLIQALEVRQIISLSDIEAFIPKKEIVKTINALIDLRYIEVDEKVAEKYKVKQAAYLRIPEFERVSTQLPQILVDLKRASKQKDFLILLLSKLTEDPNTPIKKSAFFEEGNFNQSHLRALLDKGLVEEYLLEEDRIKKFDGDLEVLESLSEIQLQAKQGIDQAFKNGKNVLLHGVTSSGKTHIYLEKIEETIAQGKNVLLLLPELALTKQMILRLEKKYGQSLGFYHQKLSDFERVEVWRKVAKNEIKVLVGTRNALFLPLQNMGLVIVDEEHDSGYRPREVAPYFNAKDAAIAFGKFYEAPVLLGSATPSLETYYAALKGKMEYIFLGERYNAVKMPTFHIINFKEAQNAKTVIGDFSLELKERIEEVLAEKKQIMILHNRRGYANVVECESCGFVQYCANCDVVMTYHKSTNEMKCHYCGQRAAKPSFCPKCHSQKLNDRGVGVERIHEEAVKLFPHAVVDRMDVDAMRKKFAYEKLYEKIEHHETDIIVGTQLISKGLDFDDIEMVGVPRADQLVYIQDFRAEEKAYQVITQVAGRTGRVSGKGRVYLQTYHPEHSVFQLITEDQPQKIYEYLLKERKKFHYPPFTKLIMIELKHRNVDKVDRASQFLGSVLRKYLPDVCVFGPEKSPVSRINTLYQYQIFLKLPRGKKYKEYKEYVLQSFKEFDEITGYLSIKRNVFVDF